MGYTAWETLLAPDVPDEIRARYRPFRTRHWRLRIAAKVVLPMAALAAVPVEYVAVVIGGHSVWHVVGLTALIAEAGAVGVVRWVRRRHRRIDGLLGGRILGASAQATDNPDTGARLGALDRLIARFRDGYEALARAGLGPAGITVRTADDLHYALAAPVIASFGLRDLLAGPDAQHPELAPDLEPPRAELADLNAAFDRGYQALAQLCDQIDAIRAHIDLAAARQRLQAALAAADRPATLVTDGPDIESMSATASSMAEFLRASLA